MKLIDADEAKKYFEMCADACIPCESEYEEGQTDAYMSAADYVSDCEIIDAEPVKHGHWEYKTRHFGGFEKRKGVTESGETVEITIDNRWAEDMPFCSVCGKFTEEAPDPPYCSNCGAKMDEV